ncbi:uncharacterized protein LOC131952947 isoform X2 [Physella acuta]|nr:uncharacterized protein LOC131952947 isoform X2 [Physella acuta]XP_059171870.1 uncharacterized protein LOC131952947 isoform X2 [Physella acuta]XP_059171871.1 uncharacterized protein LOC131952947 isoform X2 [Physella acuta]
MTVLLGQVSFIWLSVDSLGNAKHLLVKTLISNTSFSDTSWKILSSLMEETSDKVILDKVKNVTIEMDIHDELVTLNAHLLHKPDDKKVLTQHKLNLLTTTFLKYLVLTGCEARKPERYDSYCHLLFDKLARSQDGMGIVMCSLCATSEQQAEEEEKQLHSIQSMMVGHLHQIIEEDIDKCPLWTISPKVLQKAAADNKQFFILYLHALVSWTETFTPLLDKNIFIWRSASGHNVDYLTKHFICLLTNPPTNKERNQIVLDLLVDKVRETDFTVWQVLAQKLTCLLK